jgi:hypothetical protein
MDFACYKICTLKLVKRMLSARISQSSGPFSTLIKKAIAHRVWALLASRFII